MRFEINSVVAGRSGRTQSGAHPGQRRPRPTYALANKEHDTRTINAWLDHRLITSSVAVPELLLNGAALSGTLGLLTSPPVQCSPLELSEPEATAIDGPRFGGRRDDDRARVRRRGRGGLLALGFALGGRDLS